MPQKLQGQMSKLLIVGFGIVLLLLVVVAIVALVTTFTLRNNNVVVYQQLTQAELASSLQYEIVAADQARDDYILVQNPKSEQNYQDHLKKIAHIESSMRSLPLPNTGITALSIFDQQWNDYLNQNTLVFALVVKHNTTLALTIRPLPDVALHTLDGYITLATNMGDRARADGLRASVSGPTLTVIVGILAIVIGIVVATFLTRGIKRIAHQLTISLENVHLSHKALEEANTRLEALATTDPLTGLPNHRALVAALDQALIEAQRTRQTCSCLFLDLDHFKAINDSYGHAAGDTVLRELAHIARSILRTGDTVGRWGGEEFVALLPNCEPEEALVICERIRHAVAAHSFLIGGGIHMTCSIGIASYDHEVAKRDELVSAADHAMYAAKHLGRNQVRAATDPAVNTLQTEQAESREEIALCGTIEALIALIESRDQDTGEHTKAVGSLVMKVATELKLNTGEAHMLQLAGKLHDIGKVGIPDAILRKPGPLDADEWKIMKTHPIIGEHIVGRIPTLNSIAPMVRAHHERWDGKGYPDGLVGPAIPLGARIITVVDSYQAITSHRPYRQAHAAHWAIAELYRCAGTQFDPTIVRALENILVAEGIITIEHEQNAA